MTTPPPSTTPHPSPTPPPGAAPRPGPRPAPWVRTRLRAAPLGTLLAAALAFVAVLLAAALPRAQDRGADQALRSFLDRSGPTNTSLHVTAPTAVAGESPEALDGTLKSLLARTGDTFHVDPDTVVHGTRTSKRQPLLNPELSRPSGLPPSMSLLYVRQAEAHVKLVEGRWPSGTRAAGAPSGTPQGSAPDLPPLQVALSQRAAETLGARLGSVLKSKPLFDGTPSVEVVGLFAVPDETEDFWVGLDCITRACARYAGENLAWDVDALIGGGDLERIDTWGRSSENFWRLPVEVDRLRADRLDATRRQVAAYVAGPTAATLARETGRERLRSISWLPELFEQAHARRQAAAPLAAIGPAGVGGVAFVVLCLAGALAGDRRDAELRLLLARGGSRAGIVGRLLGEGAVTVLPAAAAATALAVLLLPTPRLAPALLSAAVVALLALLAFPVRAAVLLSPPRPAARWRRPVAELLVLAATAAAVLEVRRRGVAPAGSDLDPLLIAAPLLLALCGGLLLARVQPVLTGWLARAAGRRSGLVGFLGLARAARGSGAAGTHARGRTGPSVLPTVALLLAITTGGFGAAVLKSVDSSRLTVARLTVGGDAAISASGKSPLPDGLAKAAGELPGVRTLRAAVDRPRLLRPRRRPGLHPDHRDRRRAGRVRGAVPRPRLRLLRPRPARPEAAHGARRRPGARAVQRRPGAAGRAGHVHGAARRRPEVRARVAGVIDCTPAHAGSGRRDRRPAGGPRDGPHRRHRPTEPLVRRSVPSTGTGCARWSGPRSRAAARRLAAPAPAGGRVRPPRRTRPTTCIP